MVGSGPADGILSAGPKSRWRIDGSLPLLGEGRSTTRRAHQGRIRALALGEVEFVLAGADEQRRQAVVPLVTPRLHIVPIQLVARLRPFHFGGPRPCPGHRILDRHFVLERVRVETCEAFDQMQVLAGALIVSLLVEVGDIDDQRITFPVTAGISPPLVDVLWQMRGVR